MAEILYEASDVWSLFLSKKGNPGESHLLAYDDVGGEVYMTPGIVTDYLEDEILPVISFEFFGEEIAVEHCINQSDCEKTVKEMFENLEGPHQEVVDDPVEKKSDVKEIQNREDELLKATEDFLDCVIDNDLDYDRYCDEETVKKLMNKFLAFIDKEGIPIYRPTMLKDADGTLIYSEYPYRLLREE